MIIAGYEGVGKTTYARMHPEEAIDLDCNLYKYAENSKTTEGDSYKSDPKRVINPDWPFNYLEEVDKVKNNYSYTLISTDDVVLSLLKERGETFLLVRPFFGVKDEYRRRFAQRGESEEYIETFSLNWNRSMASLERVGSCVQVPLDINEYLSDVIKGIDGIGSLLIFSGFELLLTSGAIEIIKEDGFSRIEIKTDKLSWLNNDANEDANDANSAKSECGTDVT